MRTDADHPGRLPWRIALELALDPCTTDDIMITVTCEEMVPLELRRYAQRPLDR